MILTFTWPVLFLIVNSANCLELGKIVAPQEDVYNDLSDREIILTMVKRIDDLEKWTQTQQRDIDSLQTSVRHQKRKVFLLERVLREQSQGLKDDGRPEAPTNTAANTHASSDDTEDSPPQNHKQSEILDMQETSNDSEQERSPVDSPVSGIVSQGRTVKNLLRERRVTRRQVQGSHRVAFYAAANNHLIDLGLHQALVFENVTVNIGNAYNRHTGIFTAPYDGTYVFSVSLHSKEREASSYIITKNGDWVCGLELRGDDSQFSSSSHTTLIYLGRNDDVEVRSLESGNDVWGHNYSSFSGFLLYPDGEDAIVGR